MSIPFHCQHMTKQLLGKRLAVTCCLLLAGLIMAPSALAGTQTLPKALAIAPAAAVPIEQQPLTIRKITPPNIVLMLDDSGSMAWDVMPDWAYLSSHTQLALTDSSVNGIYYNPAVTYTPPPGPTGVRYPAPAFTAAPVNGFDTDPNRPVVNVSRYDGDYDASEGSSFTGNYPTGPSEINYSVAKVVATDGTVESARQGMFDASDDCPEGTDESGSQDDYCFYNHDPSPKFFEFYAAIEHGTWYVSKCDKEGYIYNKWTKNCLVKNNVSIALGNDCPNGSKLLGKTTVGYNENKKICTEFTAYHFFVYSSGGVRHYVGVTAAACTAAALSNCVAASAMGAGGIENPPTSTTAAENAGAPAGVSVGQNIANWFSYYHTRILMAKSSIMSAFSDINATYRIGFGSINNNAKDELPSHQYDSKLAEVEPFGTGGPDSQKKAFWTWVAAGKAKSSTPLRQALQSVGEYYGTSQPWESKNDKGQEEHLACRQSYVILTTDGFWNGDWADSDASGTIGNADSDTHGPITGPNGQSFTYTPAQPFSGPTSKTLADVAMYYWDHDLRTGMRNEVPTNNDDPAFWQHMVTFTIGMGYKPKNIQPADTSIADIFNWSRGGDAIDGFSWPVPSGAGGSGGSINNIADLAHAAVNGHGGFYSATDPQSFVLGLKNALQRAAERTGSGASLAANSTQLDNGTMIFQALYHTAVWTGALQAYLIDPSTGDIAQAPTWNAATEMPAAADRNIYTYDPSSDTYVAFKDSGSAPPTLSDNELTALGTDAASQASMVDYLRGNQTQEVDKGGSYRNRESILGDIVDSQPVYVGTPDANTFTGETFTGSSTYAKFASDHASRTGLVYVAANDGMLHAFNASTGVESYAFLPAAVITHGGVNEDGQVIGISELASVGYGTTLTTPHQYFNDGQMTVADAYFAEGNDSATWHTVLVGTTGRGLAETIYALDITDPSNIKFLWERSAWDGKPNSGYIGQMTGKPIIAQVAEGQWAVLIGNGYNSANGTAALLQFKLSDGTLSVHQAGTETANGLATPAVWIGDKANGISTVAYAGDIQGNVWSFSLNKVKTDNDGTTTITSTPTSSGATLFTTPEVSYTPSGGGSSITEHQPITAGMLIGKDPTTGNLWLFFGTGRYLDSTDITDTSVQSWYGLIVKAPSDPTLVTNLQNGRSALAQRFIIAQVPGSTQTVDNPDGSTSTITTQPARVVSPAPASDSNTESISGKSGWYINLETPTMNADGTVSGHVAEGERMVVHNEFEGSLLIGTSQIPKSTDLCNPSGTGWVMAIEPFTGTNPEPQFFDTNGDGLINGDDKITVSVTGADGKVTSKSYAAAGVGFNSLPNAPIFIGAGKMSGASGLGGMYGSLGNGDLTHGGVGGGGGNFLRVSWREMVNP